MAEIDRAPVVGREQVEPHDLGIDLLRDVLDEEQVARALRHLLAGQVDHAVLAPVIGERPSGRGFGLRDLVLVMRKDQVLPAAAIVFVTSTSTIAC